jgi:hypothetical protein
MRFTAANYFVCFAFAMVAAAEWEEGGGEEAAATSSGSMDAPRVCGPATEPGHAGKEESVFFAFFAVACR